MARGGTLVFEEEVGGSGEDTEGDDGAESGEGGGEGEKLALWW